MKQLLSLISLVLLLTHCGGPIREKSSGGATFVATEKQFIVEFKKVGLSAAIVAAPFPPDVDQLFGFTLRFWKTAEGSAKEGPFIIPQYMIAHPAIRLYMPEHGHGSAPFQFKKESNQFGEYFSVSNGVSTMPGKWEIQLKLRKDKNSPVEDEAIIPYVPNDVPESR